MSVGWALTVMFFLAVFGVLIALVTTTRRQGN